MSVHERIKSNYSTLKNLNAKMLDADKHDIESYKKIIIEDFVEIWDRIFKTVETKLSIKINEPLDIYLLERDPDHLITRLLV